MTDPVSATSSGYESYRVGASGDNEAAERVPDNEAAEKAGSAAAASQPETADTAQSPGVLSDYQGTAIDLFA